MRTCYFAFVVIIILTGLYTYNECFVGDSRVQAQVTTKPVEQKLEKPKRDPTKLVRTVITSGDISIALSYTKEDVFIDCRELTSSQGIVVSYPEAWELRSIYPFGIETHVYDVHFRLREGVDVLRRIDLRTIYDTSRTTWFRLHFKANEPEITFKKAS